MPTIVENLREEAIKQLFSMGMFAGAWLTWKEVIRNKAPSPTPRQIIDLGDHLKEIFYSTNATENTRTQSSVSGGGSNWEALVCWYLNLCCVGRRTVVIKHNKRLMPTPISDAITVNYGTFASNTESDLIAITFPDKLDYSTNNYDIVIDDENGDPVVIEDRKGHYNTLPVLNALVARDFEEIEIHIIQCKTNWNDNAQIPMLWDMLYSSTAFRNDISIGRNGYTINNARRFTYSFVTVPTVKLEKIKRESVCVSRVRNISGGNYWGLETRDGVANSVKEMLTRNLASGAIGVSHLNSLRIALNDLAPDGQYAYFDFPCN